MTECLNKKDEIIISNRKYTVLRCMGHRKWSHSYLITNGDLFFVLNLFHMENEKGEYSSDLFEKILDDYKKLKSLNLDMPSLVTSDREKGAIVKEYISGPSVNMLVMDGKMKDSYFDQIRNISNKVNREGLDIDYFPTNFIVNDETLYYVDYECNPFNNEKSFDNWGSKYWYMTDSFAREFIYNE